MPLSSLRDYLRRALAEDVAWGDVTTQALVPDTVAASGQIVAREPGVIAGLPVAREAFTLVDERLQFAQVVPDGALIQPGAVVATIDGPAAGLLTAERVALNYLQRLSGIATLTRRYVQAIAGTTARLVDTRKTTPGLRSLEKYAVRCGGAGNHRFGLSDGVLIKDNHIAILARQGIPLRDVVARARAGVAHSLRIEVEVDGIDQIEEALAGGADVILLDNMSPTILAAAVRQIAGRALTEASGGITLDNVRACAEAGVDLISVGALTHSVPALDLGLDIA